MQTTVLIVDDNAANRKLLRLTLAAEGYQTLEAGDGIEALDLLQGESIDVVISDILMPNMDGYRLCEAIRSDARREKLPFIFYTSTYTEASDEQLALEIGADLFLRKPTSIKIVRAAIEHLLSRQCARPTLAPVKELGVASEYSQTLLRKLEKRGDQLAAQTQALHGSEARLRAIFDAVPDCVQVIARDGKVLESNPAGLALYEVGSIAQFAEHPLTHWVAREHLEMFATNVETVWQGQRSSFEFEVTGSNGTRRWVEMHAVPLEDPAGVVSAILGITRDNSARRELEAQFVQAQKMEVVGQLAGGVAHDFNNLLGVIMGYSQLCLDGLSSGSRLHRDILTIIRTGERAAALTRQLLIFSRKEIVQPQILDLSEVIATIDPMLRRLIGENISLLTKPGMDGRCVEADLGQIEQVLMNLVVNARDAMAGGGTITISTFHERIDASEAREAGDYIVLAVADNGCGMSDEVRARIFEAFFTTKPVGRGTGLGLATCQSIAERWKGHITVESAVGVGTTFKVYLPCTNRPLDLSATSGQSGVLPRGAETVLVVEDDLGLRELAALVLEAQGYTVLKAGNGQEALEVIRAQSALSIDLVITDMVMPEMGGKMMAEWLQVTNPEVKILFTSGYTDCGLDGELDEGIAFLPKPYTPAGLVRRAREVIDAVAASAGVPAQHTLLSPVEVS